MIDFHKEDIYALSMIYPERKKEERKKEERKIY